MIFRGHCEKNVPQGKGEKNFLLSYSVMGGGMEKVVLECIQNFQ